MDCFYAAIEERDNPSLRGKPIAVGGASRRGVVCAANYEARRFGCKSAMPGFKAMQLCPQLVMLPVRFDVYRSESARIFAILGRFAEKIEPLSLDEAFMDLSEWLSEGSAIAREIRAQIYEETGLRASAGIAPNKMLAKIASDWNKPDGQHEIRAEEIDAFMKELPVSRLWGVGKRMQERLSRLGVKTCGGLQQWDKIQLSRRFGKWGVELYDLCRGRDGREVKSERVRKSISKERTFSKNVREVNELLPVMIDLQDQVEQSRLRKHNDRLVKSLVVKLKFADFTQTTVERASSEMNSAIYQELLLEAWGRGQGKEVRLVGVGIRLRDVEDVTQLEMF